MDRDLLRAPEGDPRWRAVIETIQTPPMGAHMMHAHTPACPQAQRKTITRQGICLAMIALSLTTVSGCSNAKEGALSGAGIGALTGLAIGSLSGNAGEGAAIGAIVGGVGGAVVGDQNRRRDEAARSSTTTPSQSASLDQYDRDRLALARFARRWDVSGWETAGGQRHDITGVANGAVERNYFVRLDVSVTADGQPQQRSEGSIVLGSEPGRGVTMSSRFDTSPMTFSYTGQIIDGGNTIIFNESAGSSQRGRQVTIRFVSPDEFVADVTDTKAGGESQASLRFKGAQ